MRTLLCATLLQAALMCGMSAQISPEPYADPCDPCQYAARPWEVIEVETDFVEVGGCLFKVYYKRRVCPGDGCQELFFMKAQPIAPVPCAHVDSDALATLIIGHMLIENTMNFKPDSTQLGANGCWRVTRPSCWTVRLPESFPCGLWPPEEGDTIFHITSQEYDLLPCDTLRCCTNVVFLTVDDCGELQFSVPQSNEYLTMFGQGTEAPPDSIDYDAWQYRRVQFMTMFSDTTCTACLWPQEGSREWVEDPNCHFDCPEDIIKEYKKQRNSWIRRRFGD